MTLENPDLPELPETAGTYISSFVGSCMATLMRNVSNEQPKSWDAFLDTSALDNCFECCPGMDSVILEDKLEVVVENYDQRPVPIVPLTRAQEKIESRFVEIVEYLSRKEVSKRLNDLKDHMELEELSFEKQISFE